MLKARDFLISLDQYHQIATCVDPTLRQQLARTPIPEVDTHVTRPGKIPR